MPFLILLQQPPIFVEITNEESDWTSLATVSLQILIFFAYMI